VTDDPHAALQIILREILDLFHATSGSIALLSPDTGRLEIEIQEGLPPASADVGLRPGQGITGWVAFHGRAQLVPDVAADPRYVRLRTDVR
jgi:signal transduction protein with GAF and PtsI domain